MKDVSVNVFAPTKPHLKQKEVLASLDSGDRFVLLRAGRKFRKTSLIVSWLFEMAFKTKLVCPYVAPNRTQAKNIAWDDHVARILLELKTKGVTYKKNEVELSIKLPGDGKIQLLGVENKEALRGISNWGAIGLDEYDDWEEDIYPTIIRPNLIVHKAPVIVAGTPKGFRGMYKLENSGLFKSFHYSSHDNPELDREELIALENEYRQMGDDYYQQEIMAEYVKPVGIVYREWDMIGNFTNVEYDPYLPLHLTIDFGVNDPTSLIWIQPYKGEFRIIDAYEASDGDVNHFIQVIRAKPYKTPELITGDAAGKARSITTNTSPIDEYAKHGIHIRTLDGLRIPDQIRITHKYMRSLFVDKTRAEHVRDCILNYRYPTKKETVVNQSNEIPIHDKWSHAMRALEYYFANIDSGFLSQEAPLIVQSNKAKIKKWSIG